MRALVATVILAISVAYAPVAAQATQYAVLIPVIFDGIRYDPSAFNALEQSLRGRATLHYAVLPEHPELLYAFSSLEALKGFLAARPIRSASGAGGKFARPTLAHGCPLHSMNLYSAFRVDVNCGGNGLDVPPESAIPDLGSYSGMDDNITSLVCAVDGTFTTWCVLWENTSYGGSSFWVQYGYYYNDLSPVGWSNRASSLIVYGQSS